MGNLLGTPQYNPDERYNSSTTVNSQTDIRGNRSANNNSNNTNSYIAVLNFFNPFSTSPREDYTEILRLLYNSGPYALHRKFVDEPADGTCTWVTEHQKYKDWLEEEKWGLLWLSADPGCGKSVIASFLVEHLAGGGNNIVCYFFFKRDDPEQRRATSALCAILHQLLVKQKSLCRYAQEVFKDRGGRFAEEVDTLWDILVKTVADRECGNVICVVDALDECEDVTLAPLTSLLAKLPGTRGPGALLKFLVTSRPYHKIEGNFRSREGMMRLKVEDEIGAITTDVARVIDEGIKNLESDWGQAGRLGYLRELLEASADRTFLWVSLVIANLKKSEDYSRKALTEIVRAAPQGLARFYTQMLSKSRDPEKARQILHIVLGAERPLTILEMNAAFRIEQGSEPDTEVGFERTVKYCCGLFVRVIESKVYLVHQSAREFLISDRAHDPEQSQYTLSPVESSFRLARISITYLSSLEVFEIDPIRDSSSMGTREAVRNYVEEYALLDYAASHWADHFRDSQDRQMELFELTQRICGLEPKTFMTWLMVYWENSGQCHPLPYDFTHLMIASWLGQHRVVERLLREGGNIHAQSENYGTALDIAELKNEEDITRILRQGGATASIGEGDHNNLDMESEVG